MGLVKSAGRRTRVPHNALFVVWEGKICELASGWKFKSFLPLESHEMSGAPRTF